MLFSDGVFYKTKDNTFQFFHVKDISDEDIEKLVTKIKARVVRSLKKKGLLKEFDFDEGKSEELNSNPQLSLIKGASVSNRIALGENRGHRVKRVNPLLNPSWKPFEGKLCRYDEGFSLHANLEIPKKKRKLLEKICRYITRPAISNERLSVDFNGNIIYHLKTPYSDGTTQLSFTPHEFIEKLIAIIAPPSSNLTRYHGAYGPRF